jgi:pyruvate dehydrogenase E2 component (dihydrolipoamide acetyltransferase)
MPIDILMPALSPTMTEGNLSSWLKKEGDKVKPGDVLAEIETDKATMEVESIDEGVIGKIYIEAGTENVPVNTLIAVLLEAGETIDDIKSVATSAEPAVKTADKTDTKQEEPSQKAVTKLETSNTCNNTKIFASPLAKRIAKNENIKLENIAGTGPHGRIIKADLQNIKVTESKPVVSAMVGRNPEEFTSIKNNNIRKVIAKRLLESKQTIPHFYLSIDANIDKLLALRKEINDNAEQNKLGFKLSVNDFVIKAVALAMRDVPEANSSWTDEAILLYNNVDISVAVAIDGGLITPIIKNADQKTLSTISNEMKDLAKRAKENSLKPEEFQGGGFSISNLGMFGIKKFEAIVNPPQSAILAVGASSKRPIVYKDEIKIANICDFSLSCDHRVVDGAVGANFLKAFKNYIESPFLMFV